MGNEESTHAPVLRERRPGVIQSLKDLYSPGDHVYDDDFEQELDAKVEEIEQLFVQRHEDRLSDNQGDQAEE